MMKEHCERVLREAYVFMDREVLSDEERQSIQKHLEECRPCYERYGLEVHATAVSARLRGHDPCPEKLRQAIADLLQND